MSTSETFKACCRSARDGFGGAALSHAGCFAAPAVAGLFGGSLSGAFMAAAMYVTSPLIAVGATFALDKLRGRELSVPRLLGSAAVALVIAFGINSVTGHNHDHGAPDSAPPQHQHHDHTMMH